MGLRWDFPVREAGTGGHRDPGGFIGGGVWPLSAVGGLISWPRPSRGRGSTVEPEIALQVVGEVGEADPGRGPIKADRTDEQAHDVLLGGEHALDRRSHLGPRPVRLHLRRGQVMAGLAAEVDPGEAAVIGKMLLVDLGTVGGICPSIVRRRSIRFPEGTPSGDGGGTVLAVLVLSRTAPNCALSCAAALVALNRRMKPCTPLWSPDRSPFGDGSIAS
jgi:hypothetical protein